jgi:hypothetical protein
MPNMHMLLKPSAVGVFETQKLTTQGGSGAQQTA